MPCIIQRGSAKRLRRNALRGPRGHTHPRHGTPQPAREGWPGTCCLAAGMMHLPGILCPPPWVVGAGSTWHRSPASPALSPLARSVGLGHGSRWRDQLFSLWFPPGRCVSGKRWALAPSPCTPRPSRKPFTSDALLNLPRAIAHGQRDGGRRIKPDEYFRPWSLLRLHALSCVPPQFISMFASPGCCPAPRAQRSRVIVRIRPLSLSPGWGSAATEAPAGTGRGPLRVGGQCWSRLHIPRAELEPPCTAKVGVSRGSCQDGSPGTPVPVPRPHLAPRGCRSPGTFTCRVRAGAEGQRATGDGVDLCPSPPAWHPPMSAPPTCASASPTAADANRSVVSVRHKRDFAAACHPASRLTSLRHQ